MTKFRRFKHIFRILLITLIALYFAGMVAFRLPFVQRYMTQWAEEAVEELLHTEVSIEKIDVGLFNRLILRNVTVEDQSGEELLKASRLSVKMDIAELMQGRIHIYSAQLFGVKALLYKETPDAPFNFQFIVDALSEKDSTTAETPLHLRINTLLIRRGQVKYDVKSLPQKEDGIDFHHLNIENLSATVALRALTEDSIHLQVKRLTLHEKSGLDVKKLAFTLSGNRERVDLKDFIAELPHSDLSIPTFATPYHLGEDWKSTVKSLNFSTRLTAHLDFRDIAFLSSSLRKIGMPVDIEVSLQAQNGRITSDILKVENSEKTLYLDAEGMINTDAGIGVPYFFGKVKELRSSQWDIQQIYRIATQKNDTIPVLRRIGDIVFAGSVSGYTHRFTAEGDLRTAVGSVNSNMTVHTDTMTHQRTLSGTIESDSIALNQLLANEKFGKAAFNVEIKGYDYQDKKASTYVKGFIRELDYNDYKFSNIMVDGTYRAGGFEGQASLDDPNGIIHVNGKWDTQGVHPYFNLQAEMKNFNPNKMRLSDDYKDTDISANLLVNLSGHSLDDMVGSISVDSLALNSTNEKDNFFLPSFNIEATQTANKTKRIVIQSSEMNGEIEGNYSYKTLLQSLQYSAAHYLPTLFAQQSVRSKMPNNFQLDMHVNSSSFFEKVLHIPVQLSSPVHVFGKFDEEARVIDVRIDAPKLRYNGTDYSSTNLTLATERNALSLDISSNILLKSNATLNVNLHGKALQDSLYTRLSWGNNTETTYAGTMNTVTSFSRTDRKKLAAEIAFSPSEIILKNTAWKVSPALVGVKDGDIDIKGFQIANGDKHLRINGRLGKKEEDDCVLALKDIDIEYIMQMVRFNAVEFGGIATGEVQLRHVLGTPDMSATLYVKDFLLNDANMGNNEIKAHWDNSILGIRLHSSIYNNDKELTTQVTGYVSPKQDKLDLSIEANGTNIAFLNPFVSGVFSNVRGNGYGNVRLYGPFSDLDLEGKIRANADVRVNVLNTSFKAQSDNVVFSEGLMSFQNVALQDGNGNTGTARGTLTHNKLKRMRYNFNFTSDQMLVYDTKEVTEEYPFYGRIFATGKLRLEGGGGRMDISGEMTSERNSTFHYRMGGLAQAIDTDFIKFNDKTPRKEQEGSSTDIYHHANKKQEETKATTSSDDIRFNMKIHATPDLRVDILVDPVAGDNIAGNGSGDLDVQYYNKGDMTMRGVYTIDGGTYRMSMQNIIRKDFRLREGGTIHFNGDPLRGQLNVKAVYTVPSVSLNDLVSSTSIGKSSVKVDCIIDITGIMTDPELNFDFELPSENDDTNQLVRSLTSTKEQKHTQFIYLLGVGKFYGGDNVASGYTQSDATSSLAINTLGGQLNNLIGNALNTQNWSFGANLGTGQGGWENVEAEAILSGRLLNNRLLINGNFGYRENTLRNTNFVGDFEAIWLLTKNGEWRIKGYNKTNDRYFTKSTLTTQGVGFMYQKDFTSWKDLLRWFPRKKKSAPSSTTDLKK